MTPQELRKEWDHRYQARLAILGGNAEPTEAQERMARDEANQTTGALRDYERRNGKAESGE